MVDFCMREFEKKNRGMSMKDNKRSVRRLATACERAKRTLSSATQATIEVDSI